MLWNYDYKRSTVWIHLCKTSLRVLWDPAHSEDILGSLSCTTCRYCRQSEETVRSLVEQELREGTNQKWSLQIHIISCYLWQLRNWKGRMIISDKNVAQNIQYNSSVHRSITFSLIVGYFRESIVMNPKKNLTDLLFWQFFSIYRNYF